MKRILLITLCWLFTYPVFAADNAVTLTPGAGVTMRTKDIGAGVQSPFNILGDTAGASIYGTAGTANANVLTIQGIASGTTVPVTGTVTITASTVVPVTGTVAVTQSTSPWVSNTSQINGVIPLMGNGVTGTGSQRVTIASDNTAFSVNATLSAETTKVIGTVRNADGSGNLQVGDPCQLNAKSYTPISITTNTTTKIITGASAKKTYICHLFLTSAAADNIGIVEGTTGGTCGSGTAGLIGGTTAANGPNFTANGGFTIGNGGFSVLATATNQNDVCLITSAATPLAGSVVWVQQ